MRSLPEWLPPRCPFNLLDVAIAADLEQRVEGEHTSGPCLPPQFIAGILESSDVVEGG